MQSVTINQNQANQRLDKFLKKYLPEAGSSFLYKMLRKKNITLNGKKAEGKEMLAVGDTLCFFFSEETFAKFAGNQSKDNTHSYKQAYQKYPNISILYEDDHIVMLNKPAGVLTQKAQPDDLSLNEWLIGYLLHTNAITPQILQTFHPSVCNRLDRNTSGIVLCGKSLKGSQELSRIIKERSLGKFYHTICVGSIREKASLQGYLYKDNQTNKVTVIAKAQDNASPIQTSYIPLSCNPQYTLLEVELHTGKTHQIRAHLASIGHPIIGDFKYGNPKTNQILQQEYHLSSQLLHAYRVVFPHMEGVLAPLSDKEFIAPYPSLFDQMKKVLQL